MFPVFVLIFAFSNHDTIKRSDFLSDRRESESMEIEVINRMIGEYLFAWIVIFNKYDNFLSFCLFSRLQSVLSKKWSI